MLQVSDRSHWNFPPDATPADIELALTRAKAAGLVGVLWKCTEGVNVLDHTYAWAQVACRKLGIQFGAYHFFRSLNVQAQVDWFLKNTSLSSAELAALDLEDTACTLDSAYQFVSILKVERGRFPLLYTRATYITEKIGKQPTPLSQCDLWIASYGTVPVLPPQWSTWALWQHTDGVYGSPPYGIDGLSIGDMNNFNPALGDFVSWWRGTVTLPVVQARVVAPNRIETRQGAGLNYNVNGFAKVDDTYMVDQASAKEDPDNPGVIMYEVLPDHFLPAECLQFAATVPPVTPPSNPPPTTVTRYAAYKVGNNGASVNIRATAAVDAAGNPTGPVVTSAPNGTPMQVIVGSPMAQVVSVVVAGKTYSGYALNSLLSEVYPPK